MVSVTRVHCEKTTVQQQHRFGGGEDSCGLKNRVLDGPDHHRRESVLLKGGNAVFCFVLHRIYTNLSDTHRVRTVETSFFYTYNHHRSYFPNADGSLNTVKMQPSSLGCSYLALHRDLSTFKDLNHLI